MNEIETSEFSTEKDLILQIKESVINTSEQANDLLKLVKRIAYFCPLEHVADPFFILYYTYRQKIEIIGNIIRNLEKISEVSDDEFHKLTQPFTLTNKENEDISLLQDSTDVSDISLFIYNDIQSDDKEAQIRNFQDYPIHLKLNSNFQKIFFELDESKNYFSLHDVMANDYFLSRLYQTQEYEFKIERQDGSELIKDEFAQNRNVDLKGLLRVDFMQGGRLQKHQRLLAWFPTYMELTWRSQLQLMENSEGQEDFSQFENEIFPKHVNYYFAIMAVSCFQNEYLLQILHEQFLIAGGPVEWLLFGIEQIDPKLKRISLLNEKMAFRPWSINKDDLNQLINGSEQSLNWSVHEVLKAAIILSTYHGMCGLCDGMGLLPDTDIVNELLQIVGTEVLELIVTPETFRRCVAQKITRQIPIVNFNFQSIDSQNIKQIVKKEEQSNQYQYLSNGYYTTEIDYEAEVSSVTSRSRRSDSRYGSVSEQKDKRAERIYNQMLKMNQKRKEQEARQAQLLIGQPVMEEASSQESSNDCNESNTDQNENCSEDQQANQDQLSQNSSNEVDNQKSSSNFGFEPSNIQADLENLEFQEDDIPKPIQMQKAKLKSSGQQKISQQLSVTQDQQKLQVFNSLLDEANSNIRSKELGRASVDIKQSKIKSKFQEEEKKEQSKENIVEECDPLRRYIQQSPVKIISEICYKNNLIFDKHRLCKINTYENFDHKVWGFIDSYVFNWNLHGYDAFAKFLPVTIRLVQEQMSFAFEMTRKQFSNKDVDTSDFRLSIVNYLRQIHGIRDETIQMKTINKIFKIEEKTFIKNLMCKPQDISLQSYSQFVQTLYDSEKCHVCILAAETKKEVSLVYLAHALSEYIS